MHTSSVVDAERQVSEAAFRGDLVSVMLATGTLAQGLNLPATMVIVGAPTWRIAEPLGPRKVGSGAWPSS